MFALRQSYHSLCTKRGNYSGVVTFVKEAAVHTYAAESGLMGDTASGLCSEAAAAAIAGLAFSPSLSLRRLALDNAVHSLGAMHNALLYMIAMSFKKGN